jgi:hypothetical protein
MPSTPTTKYGFITEADADALVGAPARLRTLVTAIDSNMAGYASGTIASLPAAAAAGLIYRATDVRAILLDTGSAWVDLVPQRVTSLPGTPYDGQEIIFVADSSNGSLWHLRYNASGGTYKWEFIGGTPIGDEIQTSESTSSASYVDLTTVGPQVTVPLAGEYLVDTGAVMGAAATNVTISFAPKYGAVAASITDDVNVSTWDLFAHPFSRMARKHTIASAPMVVKLQYASNGGTSASFSRRVLRIRPIRVG